MHEEICTLCRPVDVGRRSVELFLYDLYGTINVLNVLASRYAAAHERFKDLEGQLREARCDPTFVSRFGRCPRYEVMQSAVRESR